MARLSLKKASVQKIFSSLQLNCSGARCRYNVQEFKKARPEVRSLEKLGREGSFGLICCLVGADRTGDGGLTGGGDVVTRVSQTSFSHISINSPSILTVSMATESP